MSDSTAAGYLQTTDDTGAPLEGDALADAFQGMVVGVTGLASTLVRPRWQAKPLPMPSASTNWAAVAVTQSTPDAHSRTTHDALAADAAGLDRLTLNKTLEVLVSFYGPAADTYANRLVRGLGVEQNRDVLDRQGIKLTAPGPATHVPEQVNEQWVQRVDVPLTFRQEDVVTFPIRTIVSATLSQSWDGAAPTE